MALSHMSAAPEDCHYEPQLRQPSSGPTSYTNVPDPLVVGEERLFDNKIRVCIVFYLI
jgi:hypothetical protein